MKKILAGLIFSVGLACGQSNPSISQTLINGAITAGVYTYTINNIGQSVHTLFGTMNSGGACTQSAVVSLAGYDVAGNITNGIPIGSSSGLTPGSTSSWSVSGVFPVLKVTVNMQSNCTVRLYYIGSLYGIQTQVQPWGSCLLTTSLNVPAGTTVAILGPRSNLSSLTGAFRICSMILAPSAANTTAAFTAGTGTNCGTGTIALSNTVTFGAVQPLVAMPGAGNFVVSTGVNTYDLCLTAGVGNLTGTVHYGVW